MKKKDVSKKLKYALKFLPDKMYIQIYYFLKFKHFCNLKNPQTFNEKLQWLKLNDRKELYTTLVDKYEVKKYVANIIGEEYIIPTLGIYNNFDEIDFDKLPNQFVIKCTHDSEGIVICKDKSKLNIKEAKEKIEKCLKYNFYYIGREWPYKNVKPRIIVEEYMEDKDKTTDLKDYKFMCFNSKMKCCFVCFDRDENNNPLINIYDPKWNKMPFQRKSEGSNRVLKKPNQYEKMIELAEILSKGMPFARIDFYAVDNKIYFGEITLYPAGGFKKFDPDEYDKILGDWLELK